jgi:hypothetical protein
METYRAIGRSASTAVDITGVYLGTIKRVDVALKQVWVEIPRLNAGYQYGPVTVATTPFPMVGDRVTCSFLEGRTSTLLVLGVVLTPDSPQYVPPIVCTSTTRPSPVPVGTIIFETDSLNVYVWTGSAWGPLGTGGEGFHSGGSISGTYNIDLSLGSFHVVDVVDEVEITIENSVPAGTVGRFSIQVFMGSTFYPILWPESFQWAFDLGPIAPEANESMTFHGYTWDGGENWFIRLPDFV